jgi:hypothetical protein
LEEVIEVLEKILEMQAENPDNLVFNNYVELQTVINLLVDKNIITLDEFKEEKLETVKSMITDGISKGLFSEKTCELFQNQLERLNKVEVEKLGA